MTPRQIKKFPKDPGPAAWNAILPPPAPANPLDGARACDWLIIGAGFAGLSAARRLAQIAPGDKIMVLEAVRVADGPAGRNSGFMIDLPHDLSSDDYAGGSADADRKQTEMNRAAIAFAAEAAQEYGFADEVFSQSGKINAAATSRGLALNADFSKHLTAMGEAHEQLDAGAMADLLGTDYYRAGLFTPGTAMLQPAAYNRGIADGLRDQVSIHENSPVQSLERRDGAWHVRTPDGSVSAPKVILAVNGHIQNFGFFERRLMHVFTYASMTRAMTKDEVGRLGGATRWGVLPADPMGSTVRRISGIGGDRIIVRTRFTYDPKMEVSDERLNSVGAVHDRSFRHRFPMLSDVGMEYRWAGRLCLSWNGVAAFGEVDEDLYSACCQNGLGAAKGTFSGMMAAEMASGRQSPLLTDFLAADRPRRLPPEPFAWLGANATMRWKEWMAGREV